MSDVRQRVLDQLAARAETGRPGCETSTAGRTWTAASSWSALAAAGTRARRPAERVPKPTCSRSPRRSATTAGGAGRTGRWSSAGTPASWPASLDGRPSRCWPRRPSGLLCRRATGWCRRWWCCGRSSPTTAGGRATWPTVWCSRPPSRPRAAGSGTPPRPAGRPAPPGFGGFADGLFDGSLCFADDGPRAALLRLDGTAGTTEPDGLIMGLLAAEIVARTGKDLADLRAAVGPEDRA